MAATVPSTTSATREMERFQPVCRTNQLGSCGKEELVNVYDNTILYTDHF